MEGLTPLPPRSALAAALARGRDRYNARVALARRGGARLDPAALRRHLVENLAPVLEAVAAAAPGRIDPVCEALFDVSLELVPRELVGVAGRHPAVNAAWRELLPRLAAHLVEAPARLTAALSNAALRLEDGPEGGAGASAWLAWMDAIAPRCPDVGTLLACGQVLAWRAGMAHWRASALAVWEALPDPLARATLGLDPDAPGEREELRRALDDRFRTPGAPAAPEALREVGRLGAFRGFGGTFLAPPRLASDGARLWAIDGEDAYVLQADCFGRTLVRASAPPPPGAKDGLRLAPDGTLTYQGLSARFPALAGARGAAAAGSLVAVLPPHTHTLVLVARTSGAAWGRA